MANSGYSSKVVLKLGYDAFLMDADKAVEVAHLLINAQAVDSDSSTSCGWKLMGTPTRFNRPTIEFISFVGLTELELNSD